MRESIPLQLNEEIRVIEGYEDLYSITSFGRVWSHKRYRRTRWFGGYFLKLGLNKDGYLFLNLYNNRRRKRIGSHILTITHFVPNPNNLPEVNHKDGNKLNNFAGTKENNYEDGNLEWCTHDENVKHAMENRLLKHKETSKFYDVCFKGDVKRTKPWRVYITVNKRQKCIGSYKTEIEAAKTYNNYVIKHNLNRSLNNIGENYLCQYVHF